MWKVLEEWVDRYLGEREAVLLALLLVGALAVVWTMGSIMAPVLAALVIAFLVQGGVNTLKRWRVPHLMAVWLVFLLYMGLFLAMLVLLLPLIVRQGTSLLMELPRMIKQWQSDLMLLPERYPQFVSEEQIRDLIAYATNETTRILEAMLSISMSGVSSLMGLVIYVILVPLMVFFMLKDREVLARMVTGLLPSERPVMQRIWQEMNQQMANYVRGKVLEILIVAAVSYITFLVLGLNYSALLAMLVGFSVLIPYIGAAVVTIPVAMVGYFQWGWGDQFVWLLIAYGIIQALDGNVLVPLLFSEAVNLHPLSIIVAVLVFGGIWGFWGIFFAIPLATLVKALYNAWPRKEPPPPILDKPVNQ